MSFTNRVLPEKLYYDVQLNNRITLILMLDLENKVYSIENLKYFGFNCVFCINHTTYKIITFFILHILINPSSFEKVFRELDISSWC